MGEGEREEKEEAAWGSRLFAGVRERIGESRSREAGLLRGARFQKREEGKERGKEKIDQLFSVSLLRSIGNEDGGGGPRGFAVTIV